MPNWTLGDLMSMATARCGRRDDISASTVSFMVNDAYHEVAMSAAHALLESSAKYSIVSGTSMLALPADHLEPIALSWDTYGDAGSNRTLEPASPSWCDAQGYYPVGTPQRYYIYGSNIQLWPSADSYDDTSGRSYVYRYRARPTDMTSLNSVPSLDTEWRKAVLYLTEAFIHEYVGNEIEGATARARYAAYTMSLDDARGRRQHAQGRMAASLVLRRSRY